MVKEQSFSFRVVETESQSSTEPSPKPQILKSFINQRSIKIILKPTVNPQPFFFLDIKKTTNVLIQQNIFRLFATDTNLLKIYIQIHLFRNNEYKMYV